MAASYPSSTAAFSTKTPGQQIAAAHVNALQDEIIAIENALRTGIAHPVLPATTNLYDLGSTGVRWRNLYLSGDLAVAGTLGVTGASTVAALTASGLVTAGGLALTTGGLTLATSAVAATTFGAGEQNDVALSANAVLWEVGSSDAGNSTTVSGIAARAGKSLVFVVNVSGNRVTLENQDTSSAAANRIQCPGAAALVLDAGDGCILYYDTGSARWRVFGYRDGTAGA